MELTDGKEKCKKYSGIFGEYLKITRNEKVNSAQRAQVTRGIKKMPEIWARAEVLPFSWRDYRDNSLPHSFLPSLCSTNKRLSICDLVCSHNASRVICSLHTLRRRCTVPEKRASKKKKKKEGEERRKRSCDYQAR